MGKALLHTSCTLLLALLLGGGLCYYFCGATRSSKVLLGLLGWRGTLAPGKQGRGRSQAIPGQ